jgi:hypothetical protein
MSPWLLVRLTRRVRRPAVLLCLLHLILAMPAVAQTPRGAISGSVKDDAGRPIADVEVTAASVHVQTRTDTAGSFVLGSLPQGPLDVSFRRLAFSPVAVSIQVPHNDTTEVEITLKIVAQQLTAVLVQADATRLRQLDAFEARRKLGIGHFITRAEIEKRNPMFLSDMVRMIPGAMLLPSSNGQVVLRFSRAGRTECPPQFYIDGVQATGFNIDDMPVGDVEGVELYSGPTGVPPEYNKLHSTVICGAVIIWTRIPGN